MRFAVSLLSVLGIASIIGTVLQQNKPYEDYIIKFGQFWFGFFEMLGLFDVYHSVWFLLILFFLVASTTLCIYRNAPHMLKEWGSFKEHAKENSLRAFSHQTTYIVNYPMQETTQNLSHFLRSQGFQSRINAQNNGSVLIAAKAGSYQRFGYILTHLAIVIICLGGLLDGNVPFKIQELLGAKKIEVRDIAAEKVPAISRMTKHNLSYRANMTLSEGSRSDVAFVRVRDGYLVQELPFGLALKDFRIEHYATGQPKSFESDVVIIDPELKKPLEKTIRVNHPLIYKGVAIYQSDFQDGGSGLSFTMWPLTASAAKQTLKSAVFETMPLPLKGDAYQLEITDFRKFNIQDLSANGKGKPKNVGPSVKFKLRDKQGQAHEFDHYMLPLSIDGRQYFVSGIRSTPQEGFRYLRIPVDESDGIDGFMQLREMMLDKTNHALIAARLAKVALPQPPEAALQASFLMSTQRLLETFSQGGFAAVSELIDKTVPEKDREKAAATYIKIISSAAFEAYQLNLQRAGKTVQTFDVTTQLFVRDSLNAISDIFFYEAPVFLQLADYKQIEASGFQLTKSPGQKWVYLGSFLLVLGIFAMIYIRERRIWFLVKAESVLFAMSSNRKNRDFDHEYEQLQTQLKTLLQKES